MFIVQECKNTNMVYLTKKAYILCQHHGFGPGIDSSFLWSNKIFSDSDYLRMIYFFMK